MSIEEYIESRNCKIDCYDTQTLVVNRSKIGELKILNYNSKKEDKNKIELEHNNIEYETQKRKKNQDIKTKNNSVINKYEKRDIKNLDQKKKKKKNIVIEIIVL